MIFLPQRIFIHSSKFLRGKGRVSDVKDPNYLGDRNFMVVKICLMSGCHLDIEYHKSSTQLAQWTDPGLLSPCLLFWYLILASQTGVMVSTLTPLSGNCRMFCLPPTIFIISRNVVCSVTPLYCHQIFDLDSQQVEALLSQRAAEVTFKADDFPF